MDALASHPPSCSGPNHHQQRHGSNADRFFLDAHKEAAGRQQCIWPSTWHRSPASNESSRLVASAVQTQHDQPDKTKRAQASGLSRVSGMPILGSRFSHSGRVARIDADWARRGLATPVGRASPVASRYATRRQRNWTRTQKSRPEQLAGDNGERESARMAGQHHT